MKGIKSAIKNPIFWIVLVSVSLTLYFIGGFVIKTIVSVLLLCVAYLVSKFTGPYMRNRAMRKTIDDIVTRRTNWNGTLKQANQMYEINKVAGYFMPYIFAIALIISIWAAKTDETQKNTATNMIEDIDITRSNVVVEDAVIDVNGDVDNEIDENTNSIQFEEGFPTPESIYTGLLNPRTRDHDSFFTSLTDKGYVNVELLEYVNDSIGAISFAPGSAEDVVYITLYEYTQREKFEKDLIIFFKDKPNCSIDFSGDGMIIITQNY